MEAGNAPGNAVELRGSLRVYFDDKDAVIQQRGRATTAGTIPSPGTAALPELGR